MPSISELKNQSSPPLVTIGLTTYNSIDSVEKAIKSALNQAWRPVEIVVVDDCSVDGTTELLKSLEANHPEIKVFYNEQNFGVAKSRNRIVEEATGEFIAFFDDDDESLPERVERQLARILNYELRHAKGAFVICHTARELRYPNGKVMVAQTMGLVEGVRAPSGCAVARRILIGTPVKDGYGGCPTCSQMARSSVYRIMGGFDPSFRRSEDTDLNIRLALAGGHFVGVADPLVIQEMSKTPDKSLQEDFYYMRQLLIKHKDFLELEGEYKYCCEWYDVKHAWFMRRRIKFTIRFLRLFLTEPRRTLRRLWISLPNLGANNTVRSFYYGQDHSA